MFKIIGADQKEYGPISIEQIRQWIRDGRLNAQTPAQREGATDWQQLGAYSEFADLFQPAAGAAPGAATPVTSAPSPMPGAMPTGSQEAALSAVKGPAIALIVISALGIVMSLFGALKNLMGGGRPIPNMDQLPPFLQHILLYTQGPRGALINLVAVAISVFVLFGAIKMMKLQNHTLAIVTCIVALLPCSCCCLAIPFGIWGLIVLNKPEVKSQFTN